MPLTVMQIIPNLGAGGAEQSCVEIVSGLVSQGYRSLVVSAGGRRVREILDLGGEHIELPVHSKNPGTMLGNARTLARLARTQGVDILHARSRAPAWSAWLASRWTGTPFVTTFHAAYKAQNPLKRAYNAVMTRGDRVIAISDFIRQHILAEYALDPAKIVVIPRCVDLEIFAPDRVTEARCQVLRQQWQVNPRQRVILLPARLSPIKGHLTLLKAMAGLVAAFPDIVAVLVGDDQGRTAYRQHLQDTATALGLEANVRIVGHCSDMAAAYLLSSAVVAPSLVPEGFGRVPVEAMAMGIPVIASDLGAYRETVLPDETGWLFPPEDSEAFARAIHLALTLPSERRVALAHAAIRRARSKYATSRMVEATLAVYRALVPSKAGSLK